MRTITLALAAAVLLAAPATAQSQDDMARIEVAAARHALASGNIARNMIRVDSMYSTRTVPATPTSRLRPAARTRAITSAVTVPGAYERPYGGTLLLLSEPIVNGDRAEVVTTVLHSLATGRLTFETLSVTVQRTNGGWSVVDAKRLGRGE